MAAPAAAQSSLRARCVGSSRRSAEAPSTRVSRAWRMTSITRPMRCVSPRSTPSPTGRRSGPRSATGEAWRCLRHAIRPDRGIRGGWSPSRGDRESRFVQRSESRRDRRSVHDVSRRPACVSEPGAAQGRAGGPCVGLAGAGRTGARRRKEPAGASSRCAASISGRIGGCGTRDRARPRLTTAASSFRSRQGFRPGCPYLRDRPRRASAARTSDAGSTSGSTSRQDRLITRDIEEAARKGGLFRIYISKP